MSPKKILVILSDAHSFPLVKTSGEDAGKKTEQDSGFFLAELTRPLEKILNAGYEVTFASPKGEEPKPDPNSYYFAAVAGGFYERQKEDAILDRMKKENGFASPRKFESISNEELASHKPTAAICHGPYAFLSTQHSGDGSFAYKGYKITSWSDAEEKVMETMLGGEIPKVESALKDAGAEMVEGVKEKAGFITVDREVVSGGNPLAANSLGDQLLKMLA